MGSPFPRATSRSATTNITLDCLLELVCFTMGGDTTRWFRPVEAVSADVTAGARHFYDAARSGVRTKPFATHAIVLAPAPLGAVLGLRLALCLRLRNWAGHGWQVTFGCKDAVHGWHVRHWADEHALHGRGQNSNCSTMIGCRGCQQFLAECISWQRMTHCSQQ